MKSEQTERLLEQERLLPFLSDSRSYPWRPERVSRLQTHASFVFLAPPYVYKIKKPVDFGFLDYSTLEKRRHLCHREIELNRRLTQGVYLEVVPILETAGGFAFEGGGEIVEYAVKMRLLDERGFLDGRVDRGEVTREDFDRLVGVLKSFYGDQQPTQEVEERGRVPALKVSTEENFEQAEEFVGRTILPASLQALRHYTNRVFTEHGKLFDRRVEEGRILDCHGDLRLEHVHLTPEAVNIYDCIEFNDRFRYVDVASEAAFVAMDLEYRGRWDLACYFVKLLCKELRDPEMARLMNFYKCYRAFVRGKVVSFQGVAHAAKEEAKKKRLTEAIRYFQLATQYAVGGSGPMVIVAMGQVASGKSTLAKGLGEALGWEVVSSDRVRKGMAGVSMHERGTADQRRLLYSREMSRSTYAALTEKASMAGPGTGGVILDATFSRRADRGALIECLKNKGIGYCFLEAEVREELAMKRLKARAAESNVVSDAREEDFVKLSGGYEVPCELARGRWMKFDTSGPAEEALTSALNGLAERQVAGI